MAGQRLRGRGVDASHVAGSVGPIRRRRPRRRLGRGRRRHLRRRRPDRRRLEGVSGPWQLRAPHGPRSGECSACCARASRA